MLSIAKILIIPAFSVFVLGGEHHISTPYSVANFQVPQDIFFVCEDLERVTLIDKTYNQCYQEKWEPLPPPPAFKDGLTDERQCCFYLDKECQFEKLTRDKCNITDEKGFSQMVSEKYENMVRLCKRVVPNFREGFCQTLLINPVDKPLCNKFIFCYKERPPTGVTWNYFTTEPSLNPVSKIESDTVERAGAESRAEPGAQTIDTTPKSSANVESLVSFLLIFTTISHFILI